MAQEQSYAIIDAPFSTEEVENIYSIPRGSTILHSDDGITKVYNNAGQLLLSARDSEAYTLATPNGLAKATHVYEVPDGSFIYHVGNTTIVYSGGECVLTVINQQRNNESIVPDLSEWIEQANDWSVSALDWFRAEWDCPSDPPDPDNDAVNFIFNAIEPNYGLAIIQPVLEWNYGSSGCWTGTAWVVWDGGSYRSVSHVSVSEGDTIRGTMQFSPTIPYTNWWEVDFWNVSEGTHSMLWTSRINTDEDLAVFCALEGWSIGDDDDVPGDIYFCDMEFEYNGSNVDIQWNAYIDSGFDQILSNLDVDFDNNPPIDDSWVTLYTDN
jgi:hypothetical protein